MGLRKISHCKIVLCGFQLASTAQFLCNTMSPDGDVVYSNGYLSTLDPHLKFKRRSKAQRIEILSLQTHSFGLRCRAMMKLKIVLKPRNQLRMWIFMSNIMIKSNTTDDITVWNLSVQILWFLDTPKSPRHDRRVRICLSVWSAQRVEPLTK